MYILKTYTRIYIAWIFAIFSICSGLKLSGQGATITGPSNVQPGATEYYEAQFSQQLNPYTIISWSVSGGTIISQNINPTLSPVYCLVQWDNTYGTGYVGVYEDLNGQTADLNVLIGSMLISPDVQIVSYGASPANICVDFGGGTIYSYQWEESTDEVNWNTISGEVSSCYAPPAAFQTKFYRCLTQTLAGFYYTNIAKVILPELDQGTISANQNPGYNTFNFVSSTPATGGFCNPASYQYVWEQSYEGSSWIAIGFSETYPGTGLTITGKTLIRRKITCGTESLYSNILTIIPAYQAIDFENLNYIREITVLKRGVISWYQADGLPIGDKLQSTTYLDGLGRPIQDVEKGISPSAGDTWKDIVKHYEYDAAGRTAKDFISYATSYKSGKYKENAATEQPTYVRNFFGEPTSAPTWSAEEYDNSPLNRIIKAMQPGQSWGGSGIGVSTTYDFNYDWEKVHLWTLNYSGTSIPATSAVNVYATGKLTKVISYDEKNNKVITYADWNGNVILKKVQEAADGPGLTSEHTGWVCTYYTYDDFGRLRYIISPKAVKYLDGAGGWNLSQNIIDELCFTYTYDEKGRPVTKKQPGAGEISFVYDRKDRLVLTQDANQKVKNQWSFILYDDLGRQVATGLFDNTADRAAMQTYVNGQNNGVVEISPSVRIQFAFSIFVDNPVAGTSGTNQYCNNCNAQTLAYNTITHYDNYTYAGAHSFNFTNTLAYNTGSNPDIEPTIPTNRTTGMITGEKIRIIDGDNNPFNDEFTFSTAYYDENGSSLQNLGENISHNIDYVTNQYDFAERKVSSYISHTFYGNFTITTRNEFDKIGRLTKLYKNFNNTFYKQIAEYSYDELGQLKTKRLAPGYTATGQNEITSFAYDYNIHGWLTGINKDYVLSTNNYSQWDKYFGLYLGYDNAGGKFLSGVSNGSITGTIWKSQGDNSPRKYDYVYDRLDRFVAANFNQQKRPADSWTNSEVDFSGNTEYEDGNGNIKFMKHMGVVPGINNGIIVDDLQYTYKAVAGTSGLAGNKLANVNDINVIMGQNNGLLGDFKDGSNTADDYEYDINGNLVKDFNKNIVDNSQNGVIYNFMNKPEKIIIPGKSTIEFVYDASGDKLKKKVTYADNSVRTTTYMGQFVYEQFIAAGAPWVQDELQFIVHEEGRVKIITPHAQVNTIDYELNAGNFGISWPGGKQGVFEYFVKDNLGSTRMVLTEEWQKEFYKATMENSAQATEAPLFGAVNSSGNPDPGINEWIKTRMDNSPWPGNSTGVSRLTVLDPTRKIGPNTIMKVMAGDIISGRVDYFYFTNDPTGGSVNPLSPIIGSLQNALSVNKAGVLGHGNATGIGGSLNNNIPFSLFIQNQPNSGPVSTAPKAFLNIIFLDEQFKFIDQDIVTPDVGSDYVRVSQNNNPSAWMMLQKKAPKNGWVFVYLSNESNENVYFDNLQVSQEHSRIAEESHYYPYGLKIAGISSRAFNKLQNKHGYQGEYSEQEEETGWNEFDLRMYDPQIGRWNGVDPYDEGASPYVSMDADPVNVVDPDGGEGWVRKGGWVKNGDRYIRVKWIHGPDDLIGTRFEGWEYVGKNLGIFGGGWYRFWGSRKKFYKLTDAEWDNSESFSKWVDIGGGEIVITELLGAMFAAREIKLRSGLRNIADEIPVVGSLVNSGENFAKGNWKAGLGYLVMAGVDYFTLGTGSIAKKGAQEGFELLTKEVIEAKIENNIIKNGWKVGDDITNLTVKGNVPKWNTVRQRYWKNEAAANGTVYDASNMARMKKGLAPQRINPITGKMESMELHHHVIPQRDGGLFEFIRVWPDEHRALDPFRR